MPSDPNAVRRWAAVHAASMVGADASIAGRDPAATQAIPVVIASVTETRTWRTESNACGVSLCAAPDGRLLLAVGERAGAVRIWDPATGQLLRSLTGHTTGVYSVDWGHDKDGRLLLASAGDDGRVGIWDPLTGEAVCGSPISIPERSGTGANVVSWGSSVDGRPLLAIGARGIWILDPETGDLARVGPGDHAIYTVCWGAGHHAEPMLASAGRSTTIRIHDVSTGRALHVLTGDSEVVRTVAWVRRAGEPLMLVTVGARPTGASELGSWTGESPMRLWREGHDGEFTAEIFEPSQGPLRLVSWVPLPDGRTLLIGNSENSLFVLDGDTLGLLYEQPVNFEGRGTHNLDWAVAPDGNLLLCGTSHPNNVRVWNITLDPPITVPAPRRGQASSPGYPLSTADRRGRPLIPPEDVTPQFQADENLDSAHSVRCAVGADGQILVATSHNGGRLRICAMSTGALLHSLASHPGHDQRFAWGSMPDGRLLLAAASRAGPDIQIWDSSTWQLVATRVHRSESRDPDGVNCVAWIHGHGGRPQLASGSTFGGTVNLHDPDSGSIVRSLTGHGNFVHAISEGRLADGRRRLVTGNWQAPARLWDPDTGELLFEFTAEADSSEANSMWSAVWGRSPDGRPVVAIGAADGIVRIWDPEIGSLLRSLTGHEGEVYSLAWPSQPGWPSILVSSGVDRTVRIWDPDAGIELARLPSSSKRVYALDVALTPAGDLLLVIAAGDGPDDPGPVRVWRIATGAGAADGGNSGPRGAGGAYQASWLTEWLLRLGNGGLWPPLGLLGDLVTLTSPPITVPPQARGQAPVTGAAPDQVPPAAMALGDARLAALDGETGLGRLRDLAAGQPGWSPAARVAFAALLAGVLDIPEQYIPPADTDLASLRGALADSLSTPASAPRSWRVPVADVRKAAAAVTDQTVTLLRILGPDACAADPLLPLRLAHYVPRLPVLSQHELRLLAGGAGRPTAGDRAAAVGTLVYSPGTVGISRSGPPTRLLPTQLALPRDLLTVRLAEDQLLYRQHRAPTPPAPEPVTIILDTTPPTFGPAGQTLRLAVHLITTTLWAHGRHPYLITLTAPGTATELHAPADLVRVWASTTLDDPLPALAAARETATATGQPVVFCTHHHTARAGYVPGPATRLLTTHQPPEQPPRPPAGRWHAHLRPGPTREQFMAAIARLLLVPDAEDGGKHR